MDRFAKSGAEMQPDLGAFYLTLSPLVAGAVRQIIPAACDGEWLSAHCSPLEGNWEAEPVHPFCFLPASRYVERGGKQIRPLLAGLALQALGADPNQNGLALGMLETLHVTNLLMTEMVWGNPECRGGSSAVRTYGWVRVGLTYYTLRYHLFGLLRQNALGLPASRLRALYELLCHENFRVAWYYGPAWKRWQAGDLAGVETYRQSHPGSFRAAALTAAILADAPEPACKALTGYAEGLAAAYRVRGEALALQQGAAFRTGAPTFALAWAADHLGAAGRAHLHGLLVAAAQGDEEAREQAHRVVVGSGALQEAELEANRCAETAVAALAAWDVPARSKALLSALAGYAISRSA